MLRLSRRALLVSACALLSAPAHAQLIDLALTPARCVVTGDVVRVDLFATSDGTQSRGVGAIDAILTWDPGMLEFLGNDDGLAGHPWFVSGFLLDPDGINTTFADGDALYTALSQPTQAADAPPGPGLLVTSFRFRALTPFTTSPVGFAATMGTFGRTRVLDFFVPVNDITGDISSVGEVATCRVLGVNYCGNIPNSTGLPGRIIAAGSDTAAANDFTLAVRDLPLNQFGYFLASDAPGFVDLPSAGLSDGFFCLGSGPNLGRFDGQVQNSGSTGIFSIPVDLTAVPIAASPFTTAIMAGDTWYFQCWHRDINNRNNFTDAVRVMFL